MPWQLLVFILLLACNGPGEEAPKSISFNISSITPAIGPESGGTEITISGSNLKYAQSVTVDGVSCASLDIGEKIICQTPAHDAGPVSVRVWSQNEGAVTGTFTYVRPELQVTSFTPTAAPVTGGTLLTFTGSGLHSGVTVTIGGALCTGVNALSASTLRCSAPALSPGSYAVILTDDDDSVVAIKTLTVSVPPSFTGLSPTFGSTLGGTVVTITGTDFDRPSVAIGGVNCAITAKSSTSITCTTAARSAGLANIRVQNADGNGVTVNGVYTYILNPRPISVSPAHAVPAGGTTITITGSNFKTGASVDIGGDACAPVTFVSSTQLQCVTPAKVAGFYNVVVTNPDLITGTLVNGYESRELPPTVASVSPAMGNLPGGQTITITGTEFRAGVTVSIDGRACTSPTVVDPNTITCVTPAGASDGVKDIVVSNSDGQSATLVASFTYYAPPAITSVSPSGGPLTGGTLITITGTNLANGAAVTVGGNPCAAPTYYPGQTITCTVAAHVAGAVDIVVENPDTQVGTGVGLFTYADPPAVASVSPAGGRAAGGASVTITGTGFVSGATVRFDTSLCTMVTVVSDTQIDCRTPSHAVGDVDVTVTNPDTQSGTLVAGYSYQLPPTVSAVSPQGGATSGGTVITVTGTNFISGATVYLGTDVCPISALTATTVTCTTPARVAGVVNVRVLNPDTQSATLTNGYTFVEAPVITSISPNSGALAGGTLITVTGNYFIPGAVVDLGGSSCHGVTVASATSLTCTTTAHALGSVTATITIDGQTGATANAYTYAPAPTITLLAPVAGALAGGTILTITGTDFVSGVTVNLDGAPCTVSASTATSITCTTTARAAGVVTLTVTNPDNQNATSVGAYTYQNAPVVTAVSPEAISSAGGTTMTITGTDFDGSPTVDFGGSDCAVSASTATSITCTSSAHAAGVVSVTVTNSDTQSGSLPSALVYLAAPTVSAVSPSAGALAGGNALTITGSEFYTGATVDIGGADCPVTSLTATSITCTTTANVAGAYAVTVTNVDAQSGNLPGAFTYQPAPDVTSVAFNAGPVGGGNTVMITGTGFLAGAGVKFDTSDCVVTSLNATTIECTVPPHAAGTVNVTVTNTDTQTDTLSNGYTYQVAPTVSTVTPAVGAIAGGTSVTITGTGFLTGASVVIGSVNCNVTAQTSTSLTCTTGARASGVVDVQVTNADSQSGTKASAFTYLDAPTVASIAAVAGPLGGGQTVTITGSNFYAGAVVSLGGSSCTVLAVSSGSLTCLTTARAAGTVDVTVTNIDGQADTLAAAYVYRGAPTVTSVSPSVGAIGGGTPITVTGTGFVTGATVMVGSAACTAPVVNSATEIECTTALSLISGAVTVSVTNPDDLQTGSRSTAFIYLNPPTVTSVAPNAGALAGGTTITVSGTGFFPGASVVVGGVNCTSVSVNSDSSLSCTTGAHAAGAVDVVVTNSDLQVGTLTNGFTYQGAPSITSISPGSGPLGGGTAVTISGTGFVLGASVRIGGSVCTSVVVVPPTTITCNTPPGLAGAADVMVTNADGQSDTESNLYTYQSAPTVSTVSPAGGPLAGGTVITVTGTNYLAGATVTIGSTSCNVSAITATTITCTTAAASAGSYTVIVRNTDNQTGAKTNGFTYQGAPTISGISPAIGASAGGTLVTVSGTNFLTGGVVDIGGTACTGVTVTSATSLSCTTGAHAAGTGSITVTNSDGQSGNGGSYLYQDAPAVASVSPTTGPVAGGTSLTLTGTGFLAGATVAIGGTSCASVTVVNSTTITCTTTAKTAGTYNVVVTNSDTQAGTLTNGFSHQGAPTISSVSPSLGDIGGGQVITLTGTGYLAGALVAIGGTSCAVSAVTSTSITCTTGAKLAGVYDVVVTNTDLQTGTRLSGYTYVNAPTVASVSPATGTTAGGTTVTITGTDFYSGSTVDFGGSACGSVNVVSATSITCVTPAGGAGAVTVSVINPVGATGSAAGAYTYTAAAATIAFVTGTSSPNPPNPDSYGSTTTNVTHTYTVTNTGASATSNLTISIGGANPVAWAKGTDNCTGAPLAAGASCTVQVTFVGAFLTSGAYSATLTATAVTGGTVTNSMTGTRP